VRRGGWRLPENLRPHCAVLARSCQLHSGAGRRQRQGQRQRQRLRQRSGVSNLIAHRKALDAAAIAMSLVTRVPAPLKCLANQVIRSASSVPANLAEGHGRSGRDRMYHWRIAYGSAKEVDSHLRLLAHAKGIDAHGAETAVLLLDEVRAMTRRLLHPRT
jgi:four helix bundle protein